ncbi:MAG: hypothetical protein JF595_04280 [Sphingomonadales bacterium]|nr:hypothetical protein [Sphingomonadales bacterium]
MDEKTLRQLQLIGGDLCALWAEAAAVVWLRSKKLAEGGPGGLAEAGLMFTEKFAASQDLLAQLAAGKLGKHPLAVTAKTTRYYLTGVRANRRRLSRG